jgi:protein-tyrosine phosphatase
MQTPYENTYWVLENRFLAGRTPVSLNRQETYNRITALLEQNIELIINLTEDGEFLDYENEISFFAKGSGKRIEIVRKAIPDYGVPDKKLMDDILETIENALQKNRKIFVHCYGGIGRTGTVVGCYLLKNRLADKSNVFDKIKELRKDLAVTKSPETEEQRKFVLNYIN